jgi:hypothetical protein
MTESRPGGTPPIDEQSLTREGLVEVLEEKPLLRAPNVLSDEYCKRCDEKNNVRIGYDLEIRDGSFEDGERVRLACVFDPDPRNCEGWMVVAAFHLDHPQRDKDDVSNPEIVQSQATARLDADGWTYDESTVHPGEDREYHVEDRSVVRDVEIEWFSDIGDGEERDPIREPDEHGIVELNPTDPRPGWPAEENEWRERVMKEHDDWNDEIPTYGF